MDSTLLLLVVSAATHLVEHAVDQVQIIASTVSEMLRFKTVSVYAQTVSILMQSLHHALPVKTSVKPAKLIEFALLASQDTH